MAHAKREQFSADPPPVWRSVSPQEFASRSLVAMVTIPDGRTAVLGSFKKMVKVQNEMLGGWLKFAVSTREPRRVFVLMTPRIVVPKEESESLPETRTQQPPSSPIACPPANGSGKIITGLILPAPQYLEHLPQHFPPNPYFTLPHGQPNPPPERCVPPPDYSGPQNIIVVQPPAALPQDRAQGRQAGVLAELLKAYDEACAEGKSAEAKKYARAALILDPACFSKKR